MTIISDGERIADLVGELAGVREALAHAEHAIHERDLQIDGLQREIGRLARTLLDVRRQHGQ